MPSVLPFVTKSGKFQSVCSCSHRVTRAAIARAGGHKHMRPGAGGGGCGHGEVTIRETSSSIDRIRAGNRPPAIGTAAASSAVRAMSSFSSDGDDSDSDRYLMAPTLAGVQQEVQSKRKQRLTTAEVRRQQQQQRTRCMSSMDAAVAPPTNRSESIFADGGLLLLATDGPPTLNPRDNARHAPLVYHDRYSCPDWPSKHTFPMSKFERTAYSLLNDPDEFLASEEDEDGDGAGRPLVLSPESGFHRPLPASDLPASFLSPPICPDFLGAFLAGDLTAEECRIVGFREQTSRPELVERTLLEVAGTVLTAQLALRHGVASNLAGGTHHAERARGKGFTIINDMAVTARLMTWKEEEDDVADEDDRRLLREFYRGEEDGRRVDRVLVVDCDVHQGDGTATFSYDCPDGGRGGLQDRLFTLDLHAANNYPHPKETCTYDVPLPDGCDDETYLSALKSSLSTALEEVRPQLVLYNAGVDVYRGDKLGRLDLTREGMRRRDAHVIETCVEGGVPVAAVVGGGYDDDAREVGRRHAMVHRACAKVWRERQMWSRGPSRSVMK